MNDLHALKNAATILEEKCLFSSARWLCEFIEHYQIQNTEYPSLQANFFERYPLNMNNYYREAKLLFASHSFSQSAKTIEKVNHFETNLSFLFLWGYSMYMSFQEQTVRHFYEMRGNDEFTAFPVIPEENLQIILSHIDENHCDVFINYLLGLCYKQKNPTKALQYFVHGVKELFPLFWGIWIEIIHLVQSRSKLLYVLNSTSYSVFRDLFWFCFSNYQYNSSFPSTKQESLFACFSSWWFLQYQLSWFYYNQGEKEKACGILQEIIKDNHYEEEVCLLLVSILFEQKKEIDLHLLVSQVNQIHPQTPSSNIIVGCYYHLKHDLFHALSCYQQALLFLPSSSLLWSLLGQLYIELAKPSLAIKCFSRGIEIHPHDYRFYYHIAFVYEILHNPTTSIYYYKQACSLRPYDPHMRVALGEAYYAAGEIQAAIDSFLVAESLNEEEGLASRRLGQIYEKQEDEESQMKSAYFYRRYLKKKKDLVCDDDSYYPAIFLCKYYKEKGDIDNLRKICSLLVTANDEGAQEEAQKILDSLENE